MLSSPTLHPSVPRVCQGNLAKSMFLYTPETLSKAHLTAIWSHQWVAVVEVTWRKSNIEACGNQGYR